MRRQRVETINLSESVTLQVNDSRWHRVGWTGGVVLTITGVLGTIGGLSVSVVAILVGLSILALFSLATELKLAWELTDGAPVRVAVIASGGFVFVGSLALSLGLFGSLPSTVAGVVFATGVQALVLTVDVSPNRSGRRAQFPITVLGHGVVLAGTVLALGWLPGVVLTASTTAAVLLLYAVGFSAMVLNAFWTRQLRPQQTPPRPGTEVRFWEAMVLVSVIVGIVSAFALALLGGTTAVAEGSVGAQVAAAVAAMAAVLALASLSVPAKPPRVLGRLAGRLETVLQHGVAIVLFVNVLLIGVFLVVPRLFRWVLGGFLALLLFGVTLNYLMIVYVWQPDAPDKPTPTLEDGESVTVVVNGFNEFETLSESLPYNLEALSDVQFLLLPAAKSNDGTIEFMQRMAAAHPDRVRVVLGTAGSKAGDLNLAWDSIETPYALLLDADETIEDDFVARGLSVFRKRPAVGVVQGRKLAAHPDGSRLTRFVTIERQHSTWLDSVFMTDWFGASHFAGSSAMFRREVPPTVNGWDHSMLTEDIDFTIRLETQTEWSVTYESDMVAQELNPQSWWGLIIQRQRWARGWVEVAVKHLPRLLRSWRTLGAMKTFGLSWLLLTAISAPLYTITPALVAYGFIGSVPAMPWLLVILISIYLLPERPISFVYTAINDPSLSTDRRRLPAIVCYAYGWIAFGWMIQLHAMYLQLAGAKTAWNVTKKQASTTGKRAPKQTKRPQNTEPTTNTKKST